MKNPENVLSDFMKFPHSHPTITTISTLKMPNTFSQLYIQIVFAVKGRGNLISNDVKSTVNKYIAGIIKEKAQKPIIVNGMPDHIHAFVGLKPSMAISDLVREMKNNSTNFINDHKLVKGKFAWQEGYGAFSYSHSQIDSLFNYIVNQEEHHRNKTFKQEYVEFLQKFEVEYEDKYLFDWYE
ncbi:MAG TPA: IS200/IS605 family transposase [Flavisolibacter sp.]|nr:IS200/IS605 family transposase [Flavisolibacter sp.]